MITFFTLIFSIQDGVTVDEQKERLHLLHQSHSDIQIVEKPTNTLGFWVDPFGHTAIEPGMIVHYRGDVESARFLASSIAKEFQQKFVQLTIEKPKEPNGYQVVFPLQKDKVETLNTLIDSGIRGGTIDGDILRTNVPSFKQEEAYRLLEDYCGTSGEMREVTFLSIPPQV
jgi:hypothetical protein